jgi:hypothetical protein
LQHGKRYIADLSFLGAGDLELHVLCRKAELNFQGGSVSVAQKGNKFQRAFKAQPVASASLEFYVQDEVFEMFVVEAMRYSIPTLISLSTITTNEEDRFTRGVKIYDAIGFIETAKIIASAGEFVVVSVTVKMDDIKQYDPERPVFADSGF